VAFQVSMHIHVNHDAFFACFLGFIVAISLRYIPA
jgi:hypothetical protein